MKIIVCIKQILDPEIPPSKFKLDSQSLRVVPPEGIPPVMNPYDEQAVELALRLKEKHGSQITVISLGCQEATSVIKHALAMGADQGFLLNDKAFEALDSQATAFILSQAIKKIGDYDLILCGRQAADWDEGLVGSMIAENLGLPLVTLAEALDYDQGKLKVKRVILDGYQLIEVPPPAVITVSNEVGQPRLPSGWGIISASRQIIPTWKAKDLGLDPSQIGSGTTLRKLVKLYIPERKRKGEIITGKTAAEASAKLVARLVKEGVL